MAGLTLGAGGLDFGEEIPARPPLQVDTGRAPGSLPLTEAATPAPAASPRAEDDGPTVQDRMRGFVRGWHGDVGYLDRVQAAKRKEAMEVAKYQLDLMRFMREGNAQQLTAVEKFNATLSMIADKVGTAGPEETENAIRGLEKMADDARIPFAKSWIRPMVAQPDLAKLFPDLVPFVRQPAAQVIGLRLPQLLKEGKAEPALWAAALPGIQGEIDQRVERVLPRLKSLAGDKALRFDDVVGVLSNGNRAIEDYLYGRLPKDVAEQMGPARAQFLERLAASGVELPSTSAKAQETRATTVATEEGKRAVADRPASIAADAERAGAKAAAETRARLAPDIIEGEARAAGAKKAAEKRVELSPAVVDAEVRRAVATAEATERVKAKYDDPKAARATAQAVRNDFLGLPSVKTLQETMGAYGQMAEIFKGAHTTAADWSLIVGYAKINDPGSVAREGEQAAVKGLASRDDALGNAYDLFLKKKILTPEVRQSIMDAATRLTVSRIESHKGHEVTFKGIAKRNAADERDAVPDLLGRFRDLKPGPVTADAKKGDTPDARARAKFLK